MKRILTWDLPISITAAFALSYSATFMFVIRLPALDIFFTVLITCLLLSVIAAYRKPILRALPFSLILVPFVWITRLYEPLFEFAGEYAGWIWAVTPNPGFERLSVILLSIAVTAPVFTLIRCRSPAFVMMIAGGTLFIGLENAAFDYPGALFWAFLAAIMLQMAHTAGGREKKGDKEPEQEQEEARRVQSAKRLRILAAAPACLIVVFLSSLFVHPETDPLYFIRTITDNIGIFPGGSRGSSATEVTGVGREMGGPFNPTGALMLTVEYTGGSNSPAEGPYLRGGIGMEYDGRRWHGDYFEGIALGEAGLTGSDFAELWSNHSYIITHTGLRGTRLYLPGNTFFVGNLNTEADRDDLVWFTGDIIRLSNNPGAGLTYGVRSRDSHLLIRPHNSAIPEESLLDFRLLPRDMPFRVSNLAYSLARYDDDYFNALAIERYLVENFSYNPDMPQTPSGQDFVEYFLFEQREGYCTYFASAMVIMCRAVGLSARYVDGFAPSSEKDGNNVFLYTDARAHAWAEVWIEGQGWRRFEPTPGYNRVEGPVYFPQPASNPRPSPAMPSPPMEEPQYQPSITPLPSVPGSAGTVEGGWQFPWKAVLNFILPLLALYVAWVALRIKRKRFEKMLRSVPYGQKQVKRIYVHMLWLVGHANVKPEPHETLNEFADRADVAWPSNIYIMRRVADVYGKSCYSLETLSLEESETLRLYVEILERREHIHLGGTRYWLYSKILSLLPVERTKNDGSYTLQQ
ncbi:MAG: DUF3488 and transglutaminase-like domain-containing protein [Oscillospiraceae bacterium]|jgi:hypothetical protein|nr:DUF3488 and transglutaminase-like domain-containing protein [Oscillospiraceae bacterium]